MNELGFALTLTGHEKFQQAIQDTTKHVQAFHAATQAAGAPGAMPFFDRYKTAAPMQDLTQGAKGATGSTHELRAALHMLGEEIPGVGKLAPFAFSPYMLGAAGAILATQMLEKQSASVIEMWQSQYATSINTAASRLTALADVTRNAALEDAQFSAELDHANDTFDSAAHAYSAAESAIRGHIEGHRLLQDELNKTNALMLDQSELLGRISPLQATLGKLSIEAADAKDRDAQAAKKENEELAALQAKRQQDEKDKKVAEWTGRQSPTGIRRQIANMDVNIADQEKAAEKARTDLAKYQGLARFATQQHTGAVLHDFMATVGLSSDVKITDLPSLIPTTRNALAVAQSTLEVLKDKKTALQAAAADPETAIRKAQATAIQKARELGEDEAKIAKMVADNKIANDARVAAARQRQHVEDLKMQNATLQFMGLNKPDFGSTDVEKMGFAFGRGGPTLASDHARTTAEMTTQMRNLLQTLVQRNGSISFANQL